MPDMDPSMVPKEVLAQLPPEDREDLDFGEEVAIVRRATLSSTARSIMRQRGNTVS